MGKEKEKLLKKQVDSKSNGEANKGDGLSMQPPALQLKGDGKGKKNGKEGSKSSSIPGFGGISSMIKGMIDYFGAALDKAFTVIGIQLMTKAERDKLRKDKDKLDELQKKLSAQQFSMVAAALVVDTPSSCDNKTAAETEARRIISAQLSNKDIARKTIDNNIEVVVIPRSKLMTDIKQFSSLKGTKTFDGREWDPVRGSGGMKVGKMVYTAITEENLLGGVCTAVHNGKKLNTGYEEGYSTTTHEFAHTLHIFVLGGPDKKIITKAYKARKKKAKAAPDDADQWVDGREGCYASMTEHEFFAQLSNAYLGTNAGKDPYVNDPRHNGKKWVEDHEPEVYALLKKMYGDNKVDNANPKKKKGK